MVRPLLNPLAAPNLNDGAFNMWLADVDMPTPQMDPPAIYLIVSDSSTKGEAIAHRLGVCQMVKFETDDVRPDFDAVGYTSEFLGRTTALDRLPDTKMRILESPEHGELKHSGLVGDHRYIYVPGPAKNEREGNYYRGNDHFVIEVSGGGVTIEIHYTMSVDVGQPTWTEDDRGNRIPDPDRCPRESWKISNNWGRLDCPQWRTTP